METLGVFFISKEKYGFVYIWRDRKHKRYYVGCHWGTEDDGYVCSSTWMLQAYYRRPEDFKRRIIKRVYTNKLDLFQEERRYLSMIKDSEMRSKTNDNSKYYNFTKEHKNPWWSDEHKRLTIGQKISINRKGKNLGPRTPEIGRKISEAKKGKQFSEEHRKAISLGKIGTTRSEESKRAQSASLKEFYKIHTHHGIGRKHSEEHKRKIGESQKGKIIHQEQREKISKANSKSYLVTFANNEKKTIQGLKQFAKDNKIPYGSLRKAFDMQLPLKKYNITNISVI